MSVSKTDVSGVAAKAETFVTEAEDAIERGVEKTKRDAKAAVQATGEKVKSGVDKAAVLQRDSAEMAAEAMEVSATQFARYREGLRAFAEDSVQRASNYAQAKPLQTLLIAASAGALLIALLGPRRR